MTTNKKTRQPETPVAAPTTTKLDRLLFELAKEDGATLDALVTATGWQKHSVRGAIAGALKRKGHQISSRKSDGVRRYRLVAKG